MHSFSSNFNSKSNLFIKRESDAITFCRNIESYVSQNLPCLDAHSAKRIEKLYEGARLIYSKRILSLYFSKMPLKIGNFALQMGQLKSAIIVKEFFESIFPRVCLTTPVRLISGTSGCSNK